MPAKQKELFTQKCRCCGKPVPQGAMWWELAGYCSRACHDLDNPPGK